MANMAAADLPAFAAKTDSLTKTTTTPTTIP